MKIIFLDFDGVMNTVEYINASREDYHRDPIDTPHVLVLNEAIRKTGAKVVISSAWRHWHTLEELTVMLERKGFHGEIVGTTPRGDIDVPRGMKIDAWLKEHPEVTHFAILDDIENMAPHSKNHVLTSLYDGGLKPSHLPRTLELLS